MRSCRGWCLLAAILVASCGGGSERSGAPASPSGPVVEVVTVTGWTRALAVGEQIALTATAVYSDGTARDVTREAAWESSNVAVATVSDGLVTAVSVGTTAVIARFANKDGNQGVTVQRDANPI